MIILKEVDFSYGAQQIFKNFNLHLEENDFVFITGQSGSGKSTLFQLLYFNLFPQKGSVEINGYNSKYIKSKEIPQLRRELGIVFQDFKLLSDRNVYENLSLVLEVTGCSSKLIKRKVIQVLTDVGLAHKQKCMPMDLSGGEKQRVAIARAIINDPKILLADEPTGNLDPETSDEIISILKKINMRGTTILLATHNYDLVNKTEAKIYKITEGKAVKIILKKKD